MLSEIKRESYVCVYVEKYMNFSPLYFVQQYIDALSESQKQMRNYNYTAMGWVHT
jgi:hypothetical protein